MRLSRGLHCCTYGPRGGRAVSSSCAPKRIGFAAKVFTYDGRGCTQRNRTSVAPPPAGASLARGRARTQRRRVWAGRGEAKARAVLTRIVGLWSEMARVGTSSFCGTCPVILYCCGTRRSPCCDDTHAQNTPMRAHTCTAHARHSIARMRAGTLACMHTTGTRARTHAPASRRRRRSETHRPPYGRENWHRRTCACASTRECVCACVCARAVGAHLCLHGQQVRRG